MTTQRYLEKLTIKQLQELKNAVITLIAQKESAPKVLLWQVCDEDIALDYFLEKDYLKAAEHLLKTAQEYAANPDMNNLDKRLELTYITIPESEMKHYPINPS
jgi:hypothetical protein